MLDIDPYTGRERTPSPGLAMLRSIGHRARRVRSGLAQTQMLILLGVIAAIIVLGIGGFAIYRSVTSGSQDTATKQNIDRVALALETYWQQFAADRYGVADIDLVEACAYINAQFTQQEDLNIRTLAVGQNGTAAVTIVYGASPSALSTGTPPSPVGDAATGVARRMAYIKQPASADNAKANCPLNEAGIDDVATADVIVGMDDATAAVVNVAAAGTPTTADGAQIWLAAAASGDTATTAPIGPGLDDFAAAGFSQQSVWIMQPNDVITPAGATSDLTDDNEVLVIGGVSPSGNSYCLIKVFNADTRTHIGDYRFAHTYDGAAPGMAVCTQGTNGTPPTGMTRNAGWPG